MSVILLLVFLFVAGLMILMILLQEGKGGGLTGMSSGMDQVMGARNPLRRWTAYFFVGFVVIAIFINWRLFARGQHDIPLGDASPAVVIPPVTPPAAAGTSGALVSPSVVPSGEGEGTETATPPIEVVNGPAVPSTEPANPPPEAETPTPEAEGAPPAE